MGIAHVCCIAGVGAWRLDVSHGEVLAAGFRRDKRYIKVITLFEKLKNVKSQSHVVLKCSKNTISIAKRLTCFGRAHRTTTRK